MFQGHAEAYRRYSHAPIVVGIDIYNLEAEAYGGSIERPSGTGIPAVRRPICESVCELTALEPFDPKTAGRIPMVIGVARRLANEFPDADVRVPLSGPFSIASNLIHFETLLAESLTDPEATVTGLLHLVEGQTKFARAIVDAGLDVAFFESAAAPPLLSPKMFRQVELPALKAVLEGTARIVGHAVPCIMGGDTTPLLDAVLETGTDYVICPIETDQQAFMDKIRDHIDVRVRVNTLSEVMVRGTRDQLTAEYDRIRRLMRDRPNVCLGTGALPYETPPENVLWLKQLAEAD
jgi:uroporphyrinogen-III decarboxylase